MEDLQLLMQPPLGAPDLSNWISMYFPKRLELSFLKVFALPKAEGGTLVQEEEEEAETKGEEEKKEEEKEKEKEETF